MEHDEVHGLDKSPPYEQGSSSIHHVPTQPLLFPLEGSVTLYASKLFPEYKHHKARCHRVEDNQRPLARPITSSRKRPYCICSPALRGVVPALPLVFFFATRTSLRSIVTVCTRLAEYNSRLALSVRAVSEESTVEFQLSWLCFSGRSNGVYGTGKWELEERDGVVRRCSA